jgi:hypothetical protein
MAKGDEPHQDRQGEQPTGGVARGLFMHCLSAEAIHEAGRELETPGLRAMSANRSLNGMPEKNWRSTGVIPTVDFQGPFLRSLRVPGAGSIESSERASQSLVLQELR